MSWDDDYAGALDAWIAAPGEAALARGWAVGRAAVNEGVGLLDVLQAHERALDARGTPGAAAGTAREFLREVLSPFEMLLGGYREANVALRELNAGLEARVTARTSELAEAEERYRGLVEKLPAATYVCMAVEPWRTTYVSQPILTMLGFTPEEWTSRETAWLDAVHPADRERVVQLRREATGAPFRAEYRMLTRDGRVRWIRDEQRMPVAARGVPQMHGLLLDITEYRVLQEQVREAQRLESVGKLAGGVAHDFNNILCVIISFSALAMRRASDPANVRELAQIRRAAERAASLTKQLLAYSRRQVLEARVLDLGACVVDLSDMLRHTVGEDIALSTDLSRTVVPVRVDRGQLEQVLLNLVVNARDAMPSGGALYISTRNRLIEARKAAPLGLVSGTYAEIAVTDTGTGMSDEVREHLFEPFFTTKEAGKGTGLGLATSYGIVRQSGGFIEVESEPGRGTTFRVLLPGVAEAPAVDVPAGEPGWGEVGHETVLVVEDEPDVREVAVRILSEQGYRVYEAANGSDALEIVAVRAAEIQLLFTDVVMPGIQGPELAKRTREIRPDIRVLYMTGYSGEALPLAPASGHAHLLRKPFAPEQLLQMVRRTLDQ